MNSKSFTLLNNVSATGAGSAISWPGGDGSFLVGGTVTAIQLEMQFPDGTWAVLEAAATTTLTGPGGGNFRLPPGTQLRANITGGSPSGVTAKVATTNQ